MAKSKKLFTADDFTKDGGKNKSALWIIFAIIIIAAIVLAIVFLKKDNADEPKVPKSVQVEQVVNMPAETNQQAQSAVPAVETPASNSQPTPVQVTQNTPASTQPQKAALAPANTKQYSGNLSILNGKTLEEKAKVIIRGTFGNNPDRRNALGDAYQEIQDKVNEMYKNGQVY